MGQKVTKKIISVECWDCGNPNHKHLKYEAAKRCSIKQSKQRKPAFSAEEKINILDRVLRGESLAVIGRELNKSISTISTIMYDTANALTLRIISPKGYHDHSTVVRLCLLSKPLIDYRKFDGKKKTVLMNKEILLSLIKNPVFNVTSKIYLTADTPESNEAIAAFEKYEGIKKSTVGFQ